ncbi:MAG: WbqC family protein [Flavobacteriales bacterium]
MKVVLPSVYLGNIEYYTLLLNSSEVKIDLSENFQKQTYRNRCTIYGANGALNLIVPLQKKGLRSTMKTTEIVPHRHWQKLHWRSLESAYRSAPYFEYYENHFESAYQYEYRYIHELNHLLQQKILELLKITPNIDYIDTYEKTHEGYEDYRGYFTPKGAKQNSVTKQTQYIQVFGDRHGFIPNLSVLDALFNLGPQTPTLLVLK